MADCANLPARPEQRYIGKCHICRETDVSVGFCPLCCHWLCRRCSHRWIRRGLAAMREKLFGSVPQCCGPGAV